VVRFSLVPPALPFTPGRPQPETLKVLRERLAPRLGLVVFDGGAARCRYLDNEFYESFESVFGRGSVRGLARSNGVGLRILEADWLGSDKGLLYVAPHIDQALFLPWADITVSLAPERKRKWKNGVTVQHAEHGAMTWEMGPNAAANLAAIARYFNAFG
jgi:hypothetical protein